MEEGVAVLAVVDSGGFVEVRAEAGLRPFGEEVWEFYVEGGQPVFCRVD